VRGPNEEREEARLLASGGEVSREDNATVGFLHRRLRTLAKPGARSSADDCGEEWDGEATFSSASEFVPDARDAANELVMSMSGSEETRAKED
jgi:hypothetical protein